MTTDSAGAVVMRYAATQVRAILDLEGAVHTERPDAVHQMRVACRRLRSTLATYRALMDPTVAETLRRELRWLGGVLSPARDAEVLRLRLAADAPAPLSATLDALLRARHEDAMVRVRAVLGGAAYRSMRARLQRLLDEPPLREAAQEDATERLPRCVAKAVRRVDALARTADDDVLLHDVRKAAKRARYAAEVAAPALGPSYDGLASAMSALQTVLGDHQDSLVAQELLREHPLLADDEQAAALIVLEEERADQTLHAYPPALVAALAAVPLPA